MGNEAVDQLKKFNQALADFSMAENPRLIDGILLTKFDTIDDKVSCIIIGSVRRQCGGVVRPLDLKSGGLGPSLPAIVRPSPRPPLSFSCFSADFRSTLQPCLF